MNITLQPLGKIDIAVVDALKNRLTALFGGPVSVNSTVSVPQTAFNPERSQYLSDLLVQLISLPDKGKDEIVLGVVDVDIYTKDKNFIFGQADSESGKAIISLYRLNQNANTNLFMDRMVKEAVHELGHILGLDHCQDSTCIMNFSHSLQDTDNKVVTFCNKCRPKLLK
jgi:archaemetzincin